MLVLLLSGSAVGGIFHFSSHSMQKISKEMILLVVMKRPATNGLVYKSLGIGEHSHSKQDVRFPPCFCSVAVFSGLFIHCDPLLLT